jgi:hypothetical protein
VKELREAGIPHTEVRFTGIGATGDIDDRRKALDEANIFLRDIFLPRFNTQFMVEPVRSSDLHTPWRDDEKYSRNTSNRLDAIFSEQKQRKVSNDFTIRFKRQTWQLYRDKE